MPTSHGFALTKTIVLPSGSWTDNSDLRLTTELKCLQLRGVRERSATENINWNVEPGACGTKLYRSPDLPAMPSASKPAFPRVRGRRKPQLVLVKGSLLRPSLHSDTQAYDLLRDAARPKCNPVSFVCFDPGMYCVYSIFLPLRSLHGEKQVLALRFPGREWGANPARQDTPD